MGDKNGWMCGRKRSWPVLIWGGGSEPKFELENSWIWSKGVNYSTATCRVHYCLRVITMNSLNVLINLSAHTSMQWKQFMNTASVISRRFGCRCTSTETKKKVILVMYLVWTPEILSKFWHYELLLIQNVTY